MTEIQIAQARLDGAEAAYLMAPEGSDEMERCWESVLRNHYEVWAARARNGDEYARRVVAYWKSRLP